MAKRRQTDRAAARGQAQDRSEKAIGDPPPQPAEAAQTQDQTIQGQTTQERTPSRDEVALRAYDLYRQRGGGDGGDLDDWLQAERDLQQHG